VGDCLSSTDSKRGKGGGGGVGGGGGGFSGGGGGCGVGGGGGGGGGGGVGGGGGGGGVGGVGGGWWGGWGGGGGGGGGGGVVVGWGVWGVGFFREINRPAGPGAVVIMDRSPKIRRPKRGSLRPHRVRHETVPLLRGQGQTEHKTLPSTGSGKINSFALPHAGESRKDSG